PAIDTVVVWHRAREQEPHGLAILLDAAQRPVVDQEASPHRGCTVTDAHDRVVTRIAVDVGDADDRRETVIDAEADFARGARRQSQTGQHGGERTASVPTEEVESVGPAVAIEVCLN